MAILKFRVYWEEEDAIYRDILVKHTQHFSDFHQAILSAFSFDNKHDATFFRSNELWQRGREISKEVYLKEYKVSPLMMEETTVGSEIIDTNQHFVYVYDFAKSWTFLIQLIQVIKNADADMELSYPTVARTEGVGPMQYGTKGLLGEKFADIEEKYDLAETGEGFGEEGEDAHLSDEEGSDNEEEGDDDDDDSSDDDSNDDNQASSSSEFFDGDAY